VESLKSRSAAEVMLLKLLSVIAKAVFFNLCMRVFLKIQWLCIFILLFTNNF